MNKIRLALSLLASKTEYFAGKMINKDGSSMPGAVSRHLCPGFLHCISQGVKSVIVTGTNGKTTTTKIAADMMKAAGYECITNWNGSNLEDGIAVSYILNSDIKGKPHIKYAVMECDELWIDLMCDYIKPEVIVITNIFKDQIDRMIGPENVKDRIFDAIKGRDIKICLNAEDSLCLKLAEDLSYKNVVLYSEKDGIVSENGKEIKFSLSVPGEYNRKNAAAAITLLDNWGFLSERALSILPDFELPDGRIQKIKINGKDSVLMLVKNPASGNESLNYILQENKKADLFLGFNKNLVDGFDTTWIDEIDFNKCSGLIKRVYVSGSAVDETMQYLKKYKFEVERAESFHSALNESAYLLVNFSYLRNMK